MADQVTCIYQPTRVYTYELQTKIPLLLQKRALKSFGHATNMTSGKPPYFAGLAFMEIFASFIHRRFIMAHCVQEAFILIMVLIFLSKLRSFLGLWQICVIMFERRWDSFKMAVNIFRADLLALVWRLARGSTMGIPISFFFGRWCQPLSGNS